MYWKDEGYLLSKSNFDENSLIIETFFVLFSKLLISIILLKISLEDFECSKFFKTTLGSTILSKYWYVLFAISLFLLSLKWNGFESIIKLWVSSISESLPIYSNFKLNSLFSDFA